MPQYTDGYFLKQLGASIVHCRQRMGISQAELAARVGMEKSNLSVIENGRSNPQLLTLVKIAGALNTDLSDLLRFDFDYEAFMEAPSEYKARKHG